MNEYITIPLSKTGKNRGKYEAIVSIDDTVLSELRWSANPLENTVYARRTNRKHFGGMIHRVIMERVLGRPLEKYELVDHINGNGLDNRRENLRLATYPQNGANSKLYSTNTSGYKGVSFDKKRNKYTAVIEHNNKATNLGRYSTAEEAHEVYKAKAIELFGEFARFEAK